MTLFYQNATPTVSNKAVITFDDKKKAEGWGTVNIPVTVISKQILDSDGYNVYKPVTRWQVTVNEDHMVIENGVIKDKFTVKDTGNNEIKPLDLDASDMKLMRYDYVDDKEIAGSDVEITKDMLTYDSTAKEFILKLPKIENDKAKYVLVYTVKATDTSIRSFNVSNAAEFSCSNNDRKAQNAGKSIYVSFAAGAFGGDNYNKKITITKTDESDRNKFLKNAVFALYDKFGNEVTTKTTDEKGQAVFEGLTKDADYVVKEIKSPTGYQLNNKEYPVTTNEDKEVSVTDARKTTTIKFTKYSESESGDKLQGAEFTLYDESGNACGKAVSDENGQVAFENVKYGNYTIKETAAPKNYELSGEEIKVTMSQDKDGNVVVALSKEYLINYHKLGRITIIKIDSENKDKYLEGASFDLIDSNGQVVKTDTTDKDGKIEFKNVAYGTYTLSEKKAPEGYAADSVDRIVTLESDSINETFENTKLTTTIKFTKYSESESGDKLQGAEFTLYDESGNACGKAVSDENGQVAFENVKYGNYTIKETAAPKNYELSGEEIKVTMSQDENGKVVVKLSKEYLINYHKQSTVTVNARTISGESNDKKTTIKTHSNKKESANNTKLVKTGSLFGSATILLIALILVSAGIILLINRRKHKIN